MNNTKTVCDKTISLDVLNLYEGLHEVSAGANDSKYFANVANYYSEIFENILHSMHINEKHSLFKVSVRLRDPRDIHRAMDNLNGLYKLYNNLCNSINVNTDLVSFNENVSNPPSSLSSKKMKGWIYKTEELLNSSKRESLDKFKRPYYSKDLKDNPYLLIKHNFSKSCKLDFSKDDKRGFRDYLVRTNAKKLYKHKEKDEQYLKFMSTSTYSYNRNTHMLILCDRFNRDKSQANSYNQEYNNYYGYLVSKAREIADRNDDVLINLRAIEREMIRIINKEVKSARRVLDGENIAKRRQLLIGIGIWAAILLATAIPILVIEPTIFTKHPVPEGTFLEGVWFLLIVCAVGGIGAATYFFLLRPLHPAYYHSGNGREDGGIFKYPFVPKFIPSLIMIYFTFFSDYERIVPKYMISPFKTFGVTLIILNIIFDLSDLLFLHDKKTNFFTHTFVNKRGFIMYSNVLSIIPIILFISHAFLFEVIYEGLVRLLVVNTIMVSLGCASYLALVIIERGRYLNGKKRLIGGRKNKTNHRY